MKPQMWSTRFSRWPLDTSHTRLPPGTSFQFALPPDPEAGDLVLIQMEVAPLPALVDQTSFVVTFPGSCTVLAHTWTYSTTTWSTPWIHQYVLAYTATGSEGDNASLTATMNAPCYAWTGALSVKGASLDATPVLGAFTATAAYDGVLPLDESGKEYLPVAVSEPNTLVLEFLSGNFGRLERGADPNYVRQEWASWDAVQPGMACRSRYRSRPCVHNASLADGANSDGFPTLCAVVLKGNDSVSEPAGPRLMGMKRTVYTADGWYGGTFPAGEGEAMGDAYAPPGVEAGDVLVAVAFSDKRFFNMSAGTDWDTPSGIWRTAADTAGVTDPSDFTTQTGGHLRVLVHVAQPYDDFGRTALVNHDAPFNLHTVVTLRFKGVDPDALQDWATAINSGSVSLPVPAADQPGLLLGVWGQADQASTLALPGAFAAVSQHTSDPVGRLVVGVRATAASQTFAHTATGSGTSPLIGSLVFLPGVGTAQIERPLPLADRLFYDYGNSHTVVLFTRYRAEVGEKIVVFTGADRGTPTITDSGANTWTLIESPAGSLAAAYECTVTTALPESSTITVAYPDTSAEEAIGATAVLLPSYLTLDHHESYTHTDTGFDGQYDSHTFTLTPSTGEQVVLGASHSTNDGTPTPVAPWWTLAASNDSWANRSGTVAWRRLRVTTPVTITAKGAGAKMAATVLVYSGSKPPATLPGPGVFPKTGGTATTEGDMAEVYRADTLAQSGLRHYWRLDTATGNIADLGPRNIALEALPLAVPVGGWPLAAPQRLLRGPQGNNALGSPKGAFQHAFLLQTAGGSRTDFGEQWLIGRTGTVEMWAWGSYPLSANTYANYMTTAQIGHAAIRWTGDGTISAQYDPNPNDSYWNTRWSEVSGGSTGPANTPLARITGRHWHHIMLVSNPQEVRVYVDGVLAYWGAWVDAQDPSPPVLPTWPGGGPTGMTDRWYFLDDTEVGSMVERKTEYRIAEIAAYDSDRSMVALPRSQKLLHAPYGAGGGTYVFGPVIPRSGGGLIATDLSGLPVYYHDAFDALDPDTYSGYVANAYTQDGELLLDATIADYAYLDTPTLVGTMFDVPLTIEVTQVENGWFEFYAYTNSTDLGIGMYVEDGTLKAYGNSYDYADSLVIGTFDPDLHRFWRMTFRDVTPPPPDPPTVGWVTPALELAGTIIGEGVVYGSTSGKTVVTAPFSRDAPAEMWAFYLAHGTAVRWEITAGTFDTYMYVYHEDGTLLASDDDSGAGFLSSAYVSSVAAGWYFVFVTGYGTGNEGDYTLTVTQPFGGGGGQTAEATFYTSQDGTTWASHGTRQDESGVDTTWWIEMYSTSTATTPVDGIDKVASLTVGNPYTGITGAAGGGTYALVAPGPDVPDPPINRDLYCPDPDYCARLPYELAGRRLAAERGPVGPPRKGSCGWHGERFDDTKGLFALAREGGPLADLVGRVCRFRYSAPNEREPRSVVAYVHSSADTFEDVSLTRRAFLQLTDLPTDEITVEIDVLERVT